MKKFFYKTLLPLFLVGITVMSYYYLGNSRTAGIIEESRNILDTLVTIKVPSKDSKAKIEQAFKVMQKTELVGEVHKKNSLINKSISGQITVPEELAGLVKLSLEYAEMTSGSFDPTVKPLTALWNAAIKNKDLPPEESIDKALKQVGYKNLMGKHISSGDLENIDLGGILKGYAVDEAARYLAENNVNNFLISTVSSTTVRGDKNSKKPWRIGVENPRKNSKKNIIAILEFKGDKTSISTSGDYQRYFIKGRKRYTHIVDPRTGYPADKCISVTVATKESAAFADAMSTAIFVMGYPKGMDFVEKTSGIEALIVDTKGRIHVSKGMKKFLVKSEKTIY